MTKMTRRTDTFDTKLLVAQERRRWRAHKLLAPASIDDFQELATTAFRELRRKYPAPADADAGTTRRRAQVAGR